MNGIACSLTASLLQDLGCLFLGKSFVYLCYRQNEPYFSAINVIEKTVYVGIRELEFK